MAGSLNISGVAHVGVAHEFQQALELARLQRQQLHVAVGRGQDAADAEVAGESSLGDALGLVALDGHVADGQLGFLG